MVITWWKALVESDVASIDRDVKAENVAILRFLSPPHQETTRVNKSNRLLLNQVLELSCRGGAFQVERRYA